MTLIISKQEDVCDSDQEPFKSLGQKSGIPEPCARSLPIRRVVDLTENTFTDQANDDVVLFEYDDDQNIENTGYQRNHQSNEHHITENNAEANNSQNEQCVNESNAEANIFQNEPEADFNFNMSRERQITFLELARTEAVKQELLVLQKSIEKSVRDLEAENKIKEINIVQATDRERGRESYRIFEKLRRNEEYNEKKKLFEQGGCEEVEVEMAKARMERYQIRGYMDLKQMEKREEQAQIAFKAAIAIKKGADFALEQTKRKNEEARVVMEVAVEAARKLREEAVFALAETKKEKKQADILLRKAERYKMRGEGFFQQASGYKEVADKDLEEVKKYHFMIDGTMQRATVSRVQGETYQADAEAKLREVSNIRAAVNKTLGEAKMFNAQSRKFVEEAKKIREQAEKMEAKTSDDEAKKYLEEIHMYKDEAKRYLEDAEKLKEQLKRTRLRQQKARRKSLHLK